MNTLSQIIIGFVAFLHLYFLWLEMFVWTSMGPRIFINFPQDLFSKTKAMAASQGLYNGFLAAGLLWTFFISDEIWSRNIALFFLNCVLIAAIYGAFSISKKIFFVQGLPAILGILSLFM